MRMYIRKDTLAQFWDYGIDPGEIEIVADPYEGKQIVLSPSLNIGTSGSDRG